MKKSLLILNILKVFEGLVGSLVGIFVPIFLLSAGHSLRNVFAYFLLHYLAVFVFFIIGAMIASRWSLRSLLFVRYVFWFVYVGLLFYLPQIPNLIYPLAIASAISSAFFFFPFHIIFGQSVANQKMGGQWGKMMLISEIVGFFAPLLAAGLIKAWGYQSLFVVALVLMLASLYYLRNLPKIKTKINFTWSAWRSFAENNKSYFCLELVENVIEEIEGIIWPIVVYLTVKSVWSVGWVAVLASIGSIIFTWLVSKRIDKWQKSKTLMLSSILMAGIWLSRYWLEGSWIYVSSVLMGLLATVFSISFNTLIYVRAKQSNYDEFIIFREAPVFLARTCLYLLVLVSVDHLNGFFVLAAGLYVVIVLMLAGNKKAI